jgi:hypothetical protein
MVSFLLWVDPVGGKVRGLKVGIFLLEVGLLAVGKFNLLGEFRMNLMSSLLLSRWWVVDT